MGDSSFSGPVRSQNGFQHISKDASTGAITETDIVDSDGNLVANGADRSNG